MEDNFVCSFSLAIRLGISHCGEPCLTAQGAQVVDHLSHIELLTVVEDHYPRNAIAGDDILPNEFSDFGHDG